MLYLIEVSHHGGVYFPERTLHDCTKAATVRAVRSEPKDIRRILCLDPNGRWHDATVEIAQAILDDLDREPHLDLQNFLENALGCRVVASVLREMEFA